MKIDGCRKSRMIALFPDGTWKISRHMCGYYCCKQGQFDEYVGELGDHGADDDLVNDKLDLLGEPVDPE